MCVDRFIRRVLTAGVAVLCLFGARTLQAQDAPPDLERSLLYSAKFVCKNVTIPATTDIGRAFGPGVYRTVLNLQNLGRGEADLRIRVREAHAIGASPGASGGIGTVLAPGEAAFLNCRRIQRILGGSEDVMDKIDGFIVVESNRRLNAAAVYTAVTRDPDIANDGITIDVEHIRAKVRRRDGSVDEP